MTIFVLIYFKANVIQMSFKIQIPQSRNFFGITVKLVRGFKEKRKISQIFIIYNFSERINSDVALAYFLMSVLVVADRIHTVIEMNCLESFKPDYTVKFFKNSVKIIHNVITGVKNMAGIKADADFIVSLHTVENLHSTSAEHC